MKNDTKLLLVICAVFVATALASINDALLYTPDSARYLVWADALASGDGFADRTTPEPTRYVVHAPLYPILLAPVSFVFPLSVPAAKVVNVGFGVALLVLLYSFLRAATDASFAIGSVMLVSVHALFLLYSTQVLSEIPFAIALIMSVSQLLRLDTSSKKIADFAPLVLALGAGLFLREVGVTLVAAGITWFLFRKDWRSAVILSLFCGALYGLWFVRNELIVAPIEQPPLRNSRLFFTHLFTPATSSMAEEFIARIRSNAAIYAGHLSTLVFAPDFARNTHGLVTLNHPLVSVATLLVPYLKPLYLIATIGLPGSALYFRWNNDRVVRALSIVGVLYAGPILLYPINDVRFLFPIYLLLLTFMTIGAFELYRRISDRVSKSAQTSLIIAGGIIAVFPSLAWGSSFLENNYRFAHDREAFRAELRMNDALPDYYLKDIAAAGEWIDRHAPGGAVVLSRWKELALYLNGRKVIDVDPQLTPDSFDRMLRDYGVRYIATVVWRTGLRENEMQIAYSSHYAFEPVAREGSIEILEVSRRMHSPPVYRTVSSQEDSVALFRTAMMLLRRGRPDVAESLLVRVEERMGRYGAVMYQQAVARALAGRSEDAMQLFERFRTMPQAGSLVQQAWYHQEILDRKRQADEAEFPEERASKLHVVSVNYWELGYRAQSFAYIDSALSVQPAFYPALIFGCIFSYQDRDRASAKSFLERAEAVNSSNVLAENMRRVLNADDRLSLARSSSDSVEVFRDKAEAFMAMDMREDAIDYWLDALDVEPLHRQTLADLARAYEEKRRFGPARTFTRTYVRLYPDDSEMKDFLSNLERRWEIP